MKALLLIDCQNDFMPGGALPVPEGDLIVPIINQIQSKFDILAFTMDWHPENHCSFKDNGGMGIWPRHCVENSRGAQLHQDLWVKPGTDKKIVFKGIDTSVDSYSGFFDNEKKRNTGLADYLKEKGVTEVYCCGLALEYCVMWTALDAIECGFKTSLIVDACRGIDLTDCDKAYSEMEKAGIKIMQSKDLL